MRCLMCTSKCVCRFRGAFSNSVCRFLLWRSKQVCRFQAGLAVSAILLGNLSSLSAALMSASPNNDNSIQRNHSENDKLIQTRTCGAHGRITKARQGTNQGSGCLETTQKTTNPFREDQPENDKLIYMCTCGANERNSKAGQSSNQGSEGCETSQKTTNPFRETQPENDKLIQTCTLPKPNCYANTHHK